MARGKSKGEEEMIGSWFKDVKDADKVGLLLLYTGISVSFVATLAYLYIVYHSATLYEAVEDRALSGVKDFFGIGLSLITAAMGVLRFQSKSDSNNSKTNGEAK